MEITVKPVACVRSSRKVVKDDHWGEVISTIELAPNLSEQSLEGIDQFSHLDIVFYFDQVEEHKIQTEARHPRNQTAYPKVGIFAQRGKNRPNKIGLTTVRLLGHDGRTLTVQGLDAIDGTPVLDIKPVMKEFLPREDVSQPSWATDLMSEYW
ncbi:SAM-dependent methyltransferase [Paenibacillus sp. DMB20]|uniref:SAM-dependent methyltransferase n=1 Tax=Paenibacillus sp. DMB20 TaxID=1642570 RepID=UPI000627E00F|nr:SAM-dependent methyltransferase [Paenibacillus sp. DMB20]KKO51341.1 transcriptional regulator [Paenibacillus sp. DMB20]KKO51878.1 transcriptional regulator [Paenibacillus sp. DMB20]